MTPISDEAELPRQVNRDPKEVAQPHRRGPAARRIPIEPVTDVEDRQRERTYHSNESNLVHCADPVGVVGA